MQLLQICRLHIHDVNLPFHHIPKVLYWIEIWWLEFIWVKWTHCHVQETSLRWFALWHGALSCWKYIRRWYTVVIKGWTCQKQYSGRLWCLNNPQLVLSVPRKYPTHHYTTTSSLNRWYKAGWIHAFIFFTPNSDSTIWISQQIETQIRQIFSNLFQSMAPQLDPHKALGSAIQHTPAQLSFHVQSLLNPLSPRSDARFELQHVVFTTSRCLNAWSCCHVIGWLAICVIKQLNGVPIKWPVSVYITRGGMVHRCQGSERTSVRGSRFDMISVQPGK